MRKSKLKLLVVVLVLVAAAVAAMAGAALPKDTYWCVFPGTPPENVYFSAKDGPPPTIEKGGTTYTMGSDGTYRAEWPECDTWSFDGAGKVHWSDALTPPLAGPPVPKDGNIFGGM